MSKVANGRMRHDVTSMIRACEDGFDGDANELACLDLVTWSGQDPAAIVRACEDGWRARLGPDIRAGLAFRALATRIGDRGIEAIVEVARVDGIIPMLKETADFNWHRKAALALLRHPSVRKAVLSSIWS